MGCAAAMNGIQVASDYVISHPNKKALLVCIEISSVHGSFEGNFQSNNEITKKHRNFLRIFQ